MGDQIALFDDRRHAHVERHPRREQQCPTVIVGVAQKAIAQPT